MAFSIKNVMAVANNKSNGSSIPSKFAFYNADGDTATTAGLIPTTVGIKNGDQVEVIDADYLGHTFYKATVTAGVITLVVYA
jgi:hypothetical protein